MQNTAVMIHITEITFFVYDRYTLMLKCWNAQPMQRPYFSEIVAEISSMLEVSAGYLSLQY